MIELIRKQLFHNSACLGFLGRCYKLSQKFCEVRLFKLYVQAQYRWKCIWSACLADLLEHLSLLIWKAEAFLLKDWHAEANLAPALQMHKALWQWDKCGSAAQTVLLLSGNQTLLSKYLCRKDRAVFMAVLNLQLFTFISGIDSLHLSKDCEKESSETTSAFNEDERLFGDFRRHIVISQGLEETSVINALYKTAFWACFKSLKICL